MDITQPDMISSYLDETLSVTCRFVKEPQFAATLDMLANRICSSILAGGKLLIAGNGGSASDAQHIAGEFVSRLFFDRRPLPALALTADTSVLTSAANDYGYERIFERQILALGKRGDVFLGITTSGRSPNILRAFEAARAGGLVTLCLTGERPGALNDLCDVVLHAPSDRTALIQQVHIIAAHIVCGLVEQRLCADIPEAGL